ncbi:hypothetical protein CQW23_30829 [Capsicum baccatum]|uniref:F-box domain-containing protein n=1 Tax=Capsicum baccatum TaxID=33114 RepID=A0A2G2V9E6_CAPBA|nr:hypothetical protein CQW23_30829 [Capsicum baccatum]
MGRYHLGGVILGLLTLGGIDILRKRLLSKKEEKTSTNVHEAKVDYVSQLSDVDEAKVDYMSQLSGDVLSSIPSRMTIKDVVKTSILSTSYASPVQSVLFADCGGLEEIDLQATKLHGFECFFNNRVRFYFSSVPVLEHVKISLRGDASMSYIFGEFAANLPAQVTHFPIEMQIFRNLTMFYFYTLCVSSLFCLCCFISSTKQIRRGSSNKFCSVKISLRGDASMPNIFGEFAVNLPAQVTHFSTETQIFRDLRMLALLFESTYDFDIVKISPVLDACPVLQYLDISQHKTYRRKSSGSRIRPPFSPTDHTELKEVRFGGFHGTKEEIELAIYILSSATVHEAKVDYASQLPDDILSSILSRITIKDAVKTSILSRRWRYLVASMPTLKFSLDMIGVNSLHHRCCPYSQQKFLKVVNQFLQHYSGRKVVGLLTSVLFADCGGLEEIDLQATNLRGFVCFCDQKVRFYLSSVPVLERVQLSLRGDASMPYIFGEFARDQVKSLIVTASDTQVTHFPTETRIFRNLTMLALLLVNTHYFDIVRVSPVLKPCPVLEYLDLLSKELRIQIYFAKPQHVVFAHSLQPAKRSRLPFLTRSSRMTIPSQTRSSIFFLRVGMVKFDAKMLSWRLMRQRWIMQVRIMRVHEAKVDYASQLPDDVLSLIFSRMTIKDAVKTSILSTRWRYLFASMPTLQFSLDMFGVNYSVKFVLFADCGGLEEIDLQATNLHGFEWFFDNNVRFYFSSVPVLEHVKISLRGDASMPYIFGDFARGLPTQFKSLIVTACYTQVTHFPTETQIFRNLTILALLLESTYDFDIVKVSPVLDVCPVLQYLDILVHDYQKDRGVSGLHGSKCSSRSGLDSDCLTTQVNSCIQLSIYMLIYARRDLSNTRHIGGQNARGSDIRSPLSPTDHTELKEVRFGGFHGTKEEIKLAIYILKSATVLNQSQYPIDPYFKAYYGHDIWEKREGERISIHRRLRGQAISSTTVVIIQ